MRTTEVRNQELINFNDFLNTLSLQEQLKLIVDFLKENSQLRNSVAVRIFDGPEMSMYGMTVADTL